ncbi:MAG TPA: HAMP domain-containing sensor histidine kinase [Bryobacteraceae bacterium]|nr:HAMP domain-containing sensor histidine kinase [Bryobacteraceae bacterium]
MENGGRSIIRLVQAAAVQHRLEGITEMLRVVTEQMGGWGTLLWLTAPGSDIEAGTGRLFVAAYWIPAEIRVWHELSFDSMVGAVVRSGQPAAIGCDDPRVAAPAPKFMRQSQALYMCLAPIKMPDDSPGVLEVYRREDQCFSQADIDYLGQVAAVFPSLLGNLTDRVGFKMVDDVSGIIHRADPWEIGRLETFRKVVERIDDSFSCLEVSIFLENPTEAEGVYRLAAYKRVWEGPWTEKAEYKKGEGATGYVCAGVEPVRIVDLAHYQEEQAWIQHQYPGLKWNDSLHIRDRARDHFKLDDPEACPPLSWVCAPIRTNRTTWGAIRCAGCTRDPFYFDAWQAKFLDGVAVRLGACWENYLRNLSKEQELHGWEALTRGFHAMNRSVQRRLNNKTWDEAEFFREAMRLAHQVIPNTDNSDVRLVEGNELLTAATYGRGWDQHPKGQKAHYTLKPYGSTSSYLVAERKGVLIYDDVKNAPYYSPNFPETRKIIEAPMEDGDAITGVLCIRSNSPRPFPGNVKLIAGLLGQQLGLYHSLASQIRGLQDLERKHREMIETQGKTIGDVHHQVKSPIISSYRTAQNLIASGSFSGAQRQELERLRGLCSKVARVVRNMGMFSDLAGQRPIRLHRTLLLRHKLLQMLRESCADHEALTDPRRNIRFRLEEKGFEDIAGKDRIGKVLVEADWPLLEQSISNIMDNAAKYSFDGTVVRVWGGVQARGAELFIGVANEGLEVKPEEVPLLKQRGYRGRDAVAATGEGSGIGLWIVDEIMQAHGGRLAITPTQNGITEVRLVFPITKGVEKLSDAQDPLGRR